MRQKVLLSHSLTLGQTAPNGLLDVLMFKRWKQRSKQRGNANALTKPLRRQFCEGLVTRYIPSCYNCTPATYPPKVLPANCTSLSKYLNTVAMQSIYQRLPMAGEGILFYQIFYKCFKDHQLAKYHRFPCLQKQKSDQSCQQSPVSVEDQERNLPGSHFALKSFPPIFQALLGRGKRKLSGGDSRLCPPCNSIAPSLPIISGRFLLCIHYPPPSHSPVHLPPCVYRYLTPSVIVIKHSAAPSGERWLSVTMGGCNGAQQITPITPPNALSTALAWPPLHCSPSSLQA